MQNLIHFVTNHWILVALFVVLLIWVFVEEAKSKGLGGLGITPQQLVYLMNRENALVLDIRGVDAFRKAHIVGAMNIPTADLDKKTNKLNARKENIIVVVCESGQKSMPAIKKLNQLGFAKTKMLTGGFAAWKTAKMPTVSGK